MDRLIPADLVIGGWLNLPCPSYAHLFWFAEVTLVRDERVYAGSFTRISYKCNITAPYMAGRLKYFTLRNSRQRKRCSGRSLITVAQLRNTDTHIPCILMCKKLRNDENLSNSIFLQLLHIWWADVSTQFTRRQLLYLPGSQLRMRPWFNVNELSYQYMKGRYGDKMVVVNESIFCCILLPFDPPQFYTSPLGAYHCQY